MHTWDEGAIPCKRGPDVWFITAIRGSGNHSDAALDGALWHWPLPCSIPTRNSFRKVKIGAPHLLLVPSSGQGAHHFTALPSIPLLIHSNHLCCYKEGKYPYSHGSHSLVCGSLLNSFISFDRCIRQMIRFLHQSDCLSPWRPKLVIVHLKMRCRHWLECSRIVLTKNLCLGGCNQHPPRYLRPKSGCFFQFSFPFLVETEYPP